MDEPLLFLENEYELLLSRSVEAAKDSEIEAIGHQLEALEIKINGTPASSPIGLRVKMRRLWHNLADDRHESYLACYQSIGRDLDRLEAIWPDQELQFSN